MILRISTAAAFSTGFLFLFWFFFLCLFVTSFPCGRPAGSRYESATLLCQRLEETFERDRIGELDVCSDDVLRGLDYKDYGHSPAGTVFNQGTLEKCLMSNQNVEIAAFVGLDWADQKHVVTLQEADASNANGSTWIRPRRPCRAGFSSCGIASEESPSPLPSSRPVER